MGASPNDLGPKKTTSDVVETRSEVVLSFIAAAEVASYPLFVAKIWNPTIIGQGQKSVLSRYNIYCELMLSPAITRRIVSAKSPAQLICFTLEQLPW